mgnify:CR=1 FL=1
MGEDTLHLAAGVVLFSCNWWLLELPLPHTADTVFYIATLSAGYICMLMAGTWMSRLLKNNLMDDVFNTENEVSSRKQGLSRTSIL